jgi:hypothetical protein
MASPVTLEEVHELDGLFLRAFHAVEDIRRSAPLGSALHAVKVPPRLSEGIVIAYRAQLFGPCTQVLQRCAPHDVTVRTRRKLNVAVKGSGTSDWAVVTGSDRLADVIVWVDYRDRLADPSRPVLLWRIPIGRLPTDSSRTFLRSLCKGRTPIAAWPGR